MQTLTLNTLIADKKSRARLFGVDAVPVDSLRNKGANRTPAKRAALARAAARARAAGVEPVAAYF